MDIGFKTVIAVGQPDVVGVTILKPNAIHATLEILLQPLAQIQNHQQLQQQVFHVLVPESEKQLVKKPQDLGKRVDTFALKLPPEFTSMFKQQTDVLAVVIAPEWTQLVQTLA